MEIKMTDLVTTCAICVGEGTVRNSVLDNQNNSFGRRVIEASPITCVSCNGKGVALTTSGQTVIDFINLARSKDLINS